MTFIAGIIVGLLIAILIVATLTYFRRVLETKISVIEKFIEARGPKAKGFIIEPEEDIERERSKILAKNRKQGRDTPLDDLRNI